MQGEGSPLFLRLPPGSMHLNTTNQTLVLTRVEDPADSKTLKSRCIRAVSSPTSEVDQRQPYESASCTPGMASKWGQRSSRRTLLTEISVYVY